MLRRKTRFASYFPEIISIGLKQKDYALCLINRAKPCWEQSVPPIKIAIVGFGKIARDQHMPSIAQTEGLELVATVSRSGETPEGIATFPTLEALATSGLEVNAVTLCTPPEGRSQMAMAAADYGWDIILEKPPGISSAEVLALADHVQDRGQILFTTWHSQYNAAVDAAAQRLAGQDIRGLRIDWREDVRKWHPGQDWIWEASGFGVFDPGINALSIVTKIMPMPLAVRQARLTIAQNHQSPIAVDIDFGAQLSAHFDWRETEGECWKIAIETGQERLVIDKGGSELWSYDTCIVREPSCEYQSIYAHFATLMQTRQSHVDIAPLRLVEEAQTVGTINRIASFID
jgi:D-galactose 1-dehydrogenase